MLPEVATVGLGPGESLLFTDADLDCSPIFGASLSEESSGTSRTRHEKVVNPSSKIDVSGKEEKALKRDRSESTSSPSAHVSRTHMLSFSSLLMPSGGYKNSTSGPKSRSKLTTPTESIHLCNAFLSISGGPFVLRDEEEDAFGPAGCCSRPLSDVLGLLFPLAGPEVLFFA